jgi:hypothetical protein
MMNRRFAFAWLAFLLAAPAASQVAPVELSHGEQISISCAEAPECPPPPTCEDPPPTSGPPLAGLEAHWRWDVAHAVEPGIEPPVQIGEMGDPPPPGSWVHHLLALSGTTREATEPTVEWGPLAEIDGIMFDGNDQLVFQNCTVCNPGPCVCEQNPWSVGASDPWAFVLAGYVHTPGKIIGYANPAAMPSYITVSSSGAWQIRVGSPGKVTFGNVPLNTRMAAVVERRLDASLRMWRRLPCSPWEEFDIGAIAPPSGPEFGCLSCYHVNGTGTDLEYPGTIFFREGMFYRHAFDATTRAGLFAYLDRPVAEGGHREWIDAGCGG